LPSTPCHDDTGKSINTLDGWGFTFALEPIGELTAVPQAPYMVGRELAAEQLRDPNLLLNDGASEPCNATARQLCQ